MSKRIKVMLIEDSLVVREYLTHLVNADPRLEVVAAVASAEEALGMIHRVAPDVISLDIILPGMNGLDATLRIMNERPTPIVVVSGNLDSRELNISMNALRAGALSAVEKPTGMNPHEPSSRRICDQLAIMSSVKVVRQRFERGVSFGSTLAPVVQITQSGPRAAWCASPPEVLGVVASTGGPNALATLFQGLPANFPLPILLVQHITPSFLESFTRWLEGLCPFKVVIGKEGQEILPGHIYMAPVDRHLEVKRKRIAVTNGAQISAQRPSGTVLFRSMAAEYGAAAIGVILTGMGDDGAAGLLEMRNRGAFTIGEDESTCVVYGMPSAAARIGAICEGLPLPAIAARILEIATVQTIVTEATHGKRV